MQYFTAARGRRYGYIIPNSEKFIKMLRAVASKRVPEGNKEAMTSALYAILGESLPITPMDTGNLRASAGVSVTTVNRDGAIGEVYYTADYASKVHETIRPYQNGEAKFLEKGVNRTLPELNHIMGGRIKAAVEAEWRQF